MVFKRVVATYLSQFIRPNEIIIGANSDIMKILFTYAIILLLVFIISFSFQLVEYFLLPVILNVPLNPFTCRDTSKQRVTAANLGSMPTRVSFQISLLNASRALNQPYSKFFPLLNRKLASKLWKVAV